jgi:hypothetical protein
MARSLRDAGIPVFGVTPYFMETPTGRACTAATSASPVRGFGEAHEFFGASSAGSPRGPEAVAQVTVFTL